MATSVVLVLSLPLGVFVTGWFELTRGIPTLPIIGLLIVIITGIAGCVLMGSIGSLLTRAGKILTTKTGEDLIRREDVTPVLYLRSFVDDQVAAEGTPGTVPGGVSDSPAEAIHKLLSQVFFNTKSEEEILGDELNRIGPCVAVGMPGELLPPVGIPRVYFEETEWEEKVSTLMKRSRLVVMRAGMTRGFLKELEMVASCLDDPTRLLILLPFKTEENRKSNSDTSDQYLEFRQLANKVLPKELPLYSGSRVRGSSLSGIIYFQTDWTPKILKLSDVGFKIGESLETIVTRILRHGRIPY